MFKYNTNIIVNNVQGEIVLSRRNEKKPHIILLNSTGQWIVQNVIKYDSVERLTEVLARETNVTPEIIIDDVKNFIDELIKHDIIIEEK